MFVLRILIPRIFILPEIFISKIVVLKVLISAMKIIDLNAEISTEKIMIALILKIDNGNIYTAIILIN